MSLATGPAGIGDDDPRQAFRRVLRCYEPARLRALALTLGLEPEARPTRLVEQITGRLDEPGVASGLFAGLDLAPRLALGLFAMTEMLSWPAAGLAHTLRCLGLDPAEAVPPLLDRGLIAGRSQDPSWSRDCCGPVPADLVLVAHPAAQAGARTVLPPGEGLPTVSRIHQVREADGLEVLLRLAALWQRIWGAPLRQTQQGVFYKRDQERLDEDVALAGPIADRIEPLPDMVRLWIALARGVGLLGSDPGRDALVAAPADYWPEHAVHLPRMMALCWLGLRSWHEVAGWQGPDGSGLLAAPFTRPAILLWLAACAEPGWVALDDLRAHLEHRGAEASGLLLGTSETGSADGRAAPGRRGRSPGSKAAGPDVPGLIEAILLGPAYQLGLVRVAEEAPGRRKVVQLTPLGRYVLALGPPPPPREVAEQFLFVQPNFEVIAYRQGLTPARIGQLARFLRYVRPDAALQLRLTPEDTYRGLEGGLSTAAMLARLSAHAVRPLPPGVAEAVRSWASRRERVTFHPSATLIEFAAAEDLEAALAAWPPGEAPVRVTDRLLLVEPGATIPSDRFRMLGARDYRGPADACVTVEPDGVTLAIDPGRSDLFVEAELVRISEPLPAPGTAHSLPRRRFRVGRESLARALGAGLTPAQLEHWFEARTGAAMPPAVRLLLHAVASPDSPPRAGRLLVLTVPTAELLDGLGQHPETRAYLGRRLGPTAIAVPEPFWEPLQAALRRLGLPPRMDLADP